MNKIKVFLNFPNERHFVGEIFYSEKIGKYAFAYDSKFLSSGIEIAPKIMPLTDETYTAERNPDFYNIHPVFADSLPDSWGKLVQDREFEKIKMYDVTTLDRLAFVGNYGIGALQYEPALPFERGEIIVTLATLRKATQEIISGDLDNVTQELIRIGGSAGGALPKFLVDLDLDNPNEIRYTSDAPTGNWVKVLLKVPPKDDIWQRIEFTYSKMAHDAGISIPKTHLLISGQKKAFFAIERFDINPAGERLHTQTYSAIEGFSIKSGERDYIEFLRTVNALCRNHKDVVEGYRRMVFNFIGSNQDDHGKNFSFTMNSSGSWKLAPAYDIGYSDLGGIHRMSVNGKHSSIKVTDLEYVASKFEIKTWKEITAVVIDSLAKWETYAKNANVSDSMIKKIGERIRVNSRRIQKDLSPGMVL